MSLPRIELMEILQKEFKDEQTKKHLQETGKNLSTPGLSTRIFDHFPPLLTEPTVVALSSKFQTILKSLGNLNESSDGLFLGNNKDKNAVMAFEKEIVQWGCNELLNKNRDVFKLLNWDDRITSKNVLDILCAYVGAINQAITENLKETIAEQARSYFALSHFANQNYRRWTLEVLKQNGHTVDVNLDSKEDRFNLRQILRLPMEKPIVTAGLGMMGLMAIGALGMMLFKAASSTPNKSAGSSNLNTPKPHL